MVIPTERNSKGIGILFNASSADFARFILSSLNLIAKTVGGKILVLPIPDTFVVPIPIELVPTPVNGLYVSSCPVTKK